MGGLILGVNTLYRLFRFFKVFIIGGKELKCGRGRIIVYFLLSQTWTKGDIQVFEYITLRPPLQVGTPLAVSILCMYTPGLVGT